MNLVDISAIGLQVLLPLGLIIWLAFFPVRNRIGYCVQLIGTALVLLYVLRIPVWLIPPWWTPYVYLLLGALAGVWHVRHPLHVKRATPNSVGSWIATLIFLSLGSYALPAVIQSLSGRTIPEGITPVDLAFPMGPGTYLVANGGSHAIINAHYLTLHPKTARQADYRGQSYAVDFIKINRWGLRTSSWRPREPESYAIFGQPVFAPCGGSVIDSRDGHVDMPVPEMDRSRIEGNYVLLQCGDVAIFMGHLRNGSVIVSPGDTVAQGDRVGEAGNTGQTGEPHLHIHAQSLSHSGPLLAGEPLFLTLDGVFPVRNQRLVVQASPDPK